MIYIITFLEGILTFISPCLLPLLPIYFSFLGGNQNKENQKSLLINALGFVLGFSIVFIALGAAAATFGYFVKSHMNLLQVFGGIIMILFGINFMGIVQIPLLNRTKKLNVAYKVTGFFSSIIFGAIFSIGWTPCIGTFLSSALMYAANSATFSTGIKLLIAYSIGLGIPFVLSALFIQRLQKTFQFIKKHYRIINMISGLFLICLGILMITGYYNAFLALFS